VKSRVVVTAGTLLRRALEDIINVTFFASHADVRAGQFEGREIMIKCSRFPTADLVTRAAILAELAIVGIILLVAGIAIFRCSLKYVIFVASITLHFGVFALQLESRKIMVKTGRLPAGRLMAGATFFSEFAFVRIVFQMA